MSRGRGGAALSMPAAPAIAYRTAAATAPATAAPAMAEGWPKAAWIVLAMLSIVAIKIHELIPLVGIIRPALLVTGIGFVLLVRHTPRAHIREALNRPLAKLLLAYFGWCVVTAPTSVWVSQSIDSITSLIPTVLLVLALLIQPPSLKNTERIQFWWVVLFAAYGLYGRVAALPGMGHRLRFGYTYDPNDIAALMSIGFPLALGLALRGTGRARTIAIAATITCVATIVATRSRSGFVGLAVAAIAFMLATHGPRRVKMAFVILVGATLTWTFSSTGFRNRMLTMTNLEDDYNTTSEVGRKAVWARGRQYIKENPILGVGVGNFSTAEGLYWTDAGMHAKWSNAHNAYVQSYAELGIPGGTLFVLILGTGLAVAWRLSRGVMIGGVFSSRPEYTASLASFAMSAVFLSHAYFNTAFALVAFISLVDHAALRDRGQAGAALPGPTGPRRVRIPGQRGGYAFAVIHDN